jgi:zinc/manganese transport system substrate-binding protein
MKRITAILFVLIVSIVTVGASPLRVVTLSTILDDLAREIGGNEVDVVNLVRPGIDPHEFQPAPEDIRAINEADLVFANGKKMEGYLHKLKQSSGGHALWLEVGNRLPNLHFHSSANFTPDNPGAIDPHWWHSISNMKKAAGFVRDAYIQLQPKQRALFEERTQTYEQKLDELDRWAKLEVATLPREERKLVTSHDAFQYFARDFGFIIYSIAGVNTDDQPSSQKIVDLIKTIKEQKVRAVFFENIENPKVLAEITRESGAKMGGELFADGLAADGEASTYTGMMRHNISTVVAALQKK